MYKIKKGLITEVLKGKILIFDKKQSVLLELNETASFFFQQIRKGLVRKEIVHLVVKKYKIQTERAKRDFDFFIRLLKKNQILES